MSRLHHEVLNQGRSKKMHTSITYLPSKISESAKRDVTEFKYIRNTNLKHTIILQEFISNEFSPFL
jgi:hypothetical protein